MICSDYYTENLILEQLNSHDAGRYEKLSNLLEQCPQRELQELYPTIVQSIFSVNSCGLGWGLRTSTSERDAYIFNALMTFFHPKGTMFKMCYVLLNDAIKFEFNINMLPYKMLEMLQSVNYPTFYTDLIAVDPFNQQVNMLLLNSFDYFILHFVIHGTLPLHKLYPGALSVHNEHTKTVYYYLTIEYLATFLPADPEGVVLPNDLCATVKASQAMPTQPLQPTRSPKYLKIQYEKAYRETNASTNAQGAHNMDSVRAYAWRTETVLHFFVDVWFRVDISDTRDLPSSEFIRVVNVLVQQAHAFANAAVMDRSSMTVLRKMMQPMLKARIYPFLQSIICRWPVDSSMYVLLDLWLSYIQPWRYTLERVQSDSDIPEDAFISRRFDNFIADNVVIYTQVFMQILPRLERLNFASLRSVKMILNLANVFSQRLLLLKLHQAEEAFVDTSFSSESSQKNTSFSMRPHSSSWCDWETDINDFGYVPLFGANMQREMERFVRTLHVSCMYLEEEIKTLRRELTMQRLTFESIKMRLSSFFKLPSLEDRKLQEIATIPTMLMCAIEKLCHIFAIEVPNIALEDIEPLEQIYTGLDFSEMNGSNCPDISKVSPMRVAHNIAQMSLKVDPALIPIQSHECAVLVRSLHLLSCRLNDMYGLEMVSYWNRTDFWGKLTRQILYPPIMVQWFDKTEGVSELCRKQLPARICMRSLASYRLLLTMALLFLVGSLLWSPVRVIVMTLMLYVAYLVFLALISKPLRS